LTAYVQGKNFLCKYVKSNNVICKLFVNSATDISYGVSVMSTPAKQYRALELGYSALP